MVKLRSCGNSHDPRDPHAERYILRDSGYGSRQDQARIEQNEIRRKLIGRPLCCGNRTVEEREADNQVSLWLLQMDSYVRKPEGQHMMMEYPHDVTTLLRWSDEVQDWVHLTQQDFDAMWAKLEPCSECNGAGNYVGFTTVSECQHCFGRGK